MNAGDAVTNQKVSVCRLSGERRSIIIKAVRIAMNFAQGPLNQELNDIRQELEKGDEIWLIESK